tara:strand:- start:397 stop:759 length:363 start_codon:yes stop_codon:yes gene_type:complete
LDDENIGSKYKVLFNDMNNADEQIAPVKILDGQYKGMLYSYGMVQIVPKFESFANVMDDDELTLKFEYNVMKESPVEDDKSKELENLLGDILMDIIINSDTSGGRIGSERTDNSTTDSSK